MTEKGENILKAYRFVQGFFKEVAQLFRKLDDLMAKDGWDSAVGNLTTLDLSKDLLKPERWLPEASFRLYENEMFPQIRRGIVVSYIHREKIKEPVLIMGKIEYKKLEKASPWDIWSLWFDERLKRVLNKDYFESEPENKDMYIEKDVIANVALHAINLVDVASEEDIKNKVFHKLGELK
ncbi:MAG: hypothetical protein A2Z27_00320 [candidate division Zixibacteria bacterium RBG_16_50_21]|nr:MAG: hypothetical protein A2Z27_00320 [candidate division Zixibacteria bacterium RBG_16_50_21]